MQTSVVRCHSSMMRAGPRVPQRVLPRARAALVVRASQGFDPIRLGDSVDSGSSPEMVAKSLAGPMGPNKPINVGPNSTLSGASAMGTANMGPGPGPGPSLPGMDRARKVPRTNASGSIAPAAFKRARANAGPPGSVGDGPGFSPGDGGGSGGFGQGGGGSGGGGNDGGGGGGGEGHPSGEGFGGNLELALGGMALIFAAMMLFLLKALLPSEIQRVGMLKEKAAKAAANADKAVKAVAKADKALAKAQLAAVEVKSKAAAKLEQARQLESENNERAAQARAAQAEAKVHAMSAEVHAMSAEVHAMSANVHAMSAKVHAMSAKVGSAASQAPDVAHNVKHKMERAKSAVGDKAHAAGQEARGIFSSVKHPVGNAAQSMAGGAESAENKVKGSVQGGVDKVKGGSVKGGVDKVKGKVSKVKAEAKDTKGFSINLKVKTPDLKPLLFWGSMAAGLTTAATATGCLIAHIVKNSEWYLNGVDKRTGKPRRAYRDGMAMAKSAMGYTHMARLASIESARAANNAARDMADKKTSTPHGTAASR